jgi:hypothetical protein
MVKPKTVLAAVGLGLTVLVWAACSTDSPATDTPAPDPLLPKSEYHIYLCFGQSNMEGYNGSYLGDQKIKDEDKGPVDERFMVLTAVDMPAMNRQKERWYRADPPLCRGDSGISPVDYFGRTMAANLPQNIKVAVVNVAVAGAAIEVFYPDVNPAFVQEDWKQNIVALYGGSPYNRLVELAKLAQVRGKIKGILLHQGETNSGQSDWPQKVKTVYDNLVRDLELDPDTPLLAGELVSRSMDTIIGRLPTVIPAARVIQADGLPAHPDNLHFSPEGYRELGRRYAAEMLAILGYPAAE